MLSLPGHGRGGRHGPQVLDADERGGTGGATAAPAADTSSATCLTATAAAAPDPAQRRVDAVRPERAIGRAAGAAPPLRASGGQSPHSRASQQSREAPPPARDSHAQGEDEDDQLEQDTEPQGHRSEEHMVAGGERS